MDWLRDYWPIVSFVLVQFVGFVVAFTRLRGEVTQLRLDVNHLTGDAEPLFREFGEMSALFKDLIRRLDDMDDRAARDRAEVMLAIKEGTNRVEGRVNDMEKRTFDLVMKKAKDNN